MRLVLKHPNFKDVQSMISAQQWALIMCTVSKAGVNDARLNAAFNFHLAGGD